MLRASCSHVGSPIVIGTTGLVCARCEAPIVDAATPKEPEVYGSRHPYPAPPGWSHRRLREHGPELVQYGAVRTGGRRGRSVLWTISATDWNAYVLATRRTQPAPKAAVPVIDATRWLRESGFRVTKEAG